jgi:thioredoxin reductase
MTDVLDRNLEELTCIRRVSSSRRYCITVRLKASRPGVFAAGDVRSRPVKRIAAAVGEGAMAVQFVHAYLDCSARSG